MGADIICMLKSKQLLTEFKHCNVLYTITFI